MNPAAFDKIASASVAAVLAKRGFGSEGSKHCTFYRRVSPDIWHVVMPDPGSRGMWYDMKVFATSPKIEPLFDELFPDFLGIPADRYCYLDPVQGVTSRQYRYHCRTEDGFIREFDKIVGPSLLQHALPYLDRIQSIGDLVPLIQSKLYLALALSAIGDDEAKDLIKTEVQRLEALDTDDRKVKAFLRALKLS